MNLKTNLSSKVFYKRIIPQKIRSSLRKILWYRARRAFFPVNNILQQIDAQMLSLGLGSFFKLLDEKNQVLLEKLTRPIGFSNTEAKLFLLKVSNLLVGKYEYIKRSTHVVSNPFGLIVDPANGCPLHCPGCVHSKNPIAHNYLWPPGNLTEDTFRQFLEKHGPYATHIFLYNYGEPLLNNLTPKFIYLARQYLLRTVLSSNLAMSDIDFEALVLSGLDYLVLSVDGATADTYARFRKGGNLERVINNIENLIETKKRLNKYNPYVVWQFLVFKHNAHELEEVKRLAKKYRVNQLDICKPFPVDWDDPSITVEDSASDSSIVFHKNFWEWKNNHDLMLTKLNAEIINHSFSQKWSERYYEYHDTPIESTNRNNTCDYLYKTIAMDAQGRIMPCCKPPSLYCNLVFAALEGHHDAFNSNLYTLARMYFAHKEAYQNAINSLSADQIPYCSTCLHPHLKPIVDTPHVRQYLDTIRIFDVLSPKTKGVITDW